MLDSLRSESLCEASALSEVVLRRKRIWGGGKAAVDALHDAPPLRAHCASHSKQQYCSYESTNNLYAYKVENKYVICFS